MRMSASLTVRVMHGWPAGHIPSAIHRPIDGLYDEHGRLLPPAQQREVFGAIGIDDKGDLITYCIIGARAATAWFVLSYVLDRPGVRVYDGSLAEWGRRPGTPVHTD
jgi:thiosulfate/3-mercaptopyruvate sulfurtransferase